MKRRQFVKKTILFLLLAIMLFAFIIVFLKNRCEVTPSPQKIVTASACFDPQNPEKQGKISFKTIDIDKNNNVLKTTKNKEIFIQNRTNNFMDPYDQRHASRNLIKIHKPNSYFFCNLVNLPVSGQVVYRMFSIIYQSDGNMINIENDYTDSGYQIDFFVTDIDFNEENILLDNAELIKISGATLKQKMQSNFNRKSKEVFNFYNKLSKTKEARTAIFMSDKTAIIQEISEGQTNSIIISSSNPKDCRKLQIGFYPYNSFRPYISLPLDYSKDNSKIGFLASETIDRKNSGNCWLYIWNLNTNKQEKIFEVKDSGFFDIRYAKPDYMKWNPKNPELIAFFCKQGLFLINCNTWESKNLISLGADLPNDLKNFRWSPDGKKIGIIDYNGRLYIYDLEKKTTKKVSEDPDCFDFFWVE